MITINENYLKLQDSYLFSTIAKKVEEFTKNNPDFSCPIFVEIPGYAGRRNASNESCRQYF